MITFARHSENVEDFCLRFGKNSQYNTFEDAVRPANFDVVIKAVKKVSGYDEEKNRYSTPSLALKLGHSLQKVSDILHCRALMAQDSTLIKSTKPSMLQSGPNSSPILR